MDGDPVWLASLSQRNKKTDKIIAVSKWERQRVEAATGILVHVLDGLGNPDRQRLFRMNATICMHRALSAAEIAHLPATFTSAQPIDIAGGPVAILWETVPGKASTKPCEHPRKWVMDPKRPELWVPLDCGDCRPCRARERLSSYLPTNPAMMGR